MIATGAARGPRDRRVDALAKLAALGVKVGRAGRLDRRIRAAVATGRRRRHRDARG
jgi:hypothetical protein